MRSLRSTTANPARRVALVALVLAALPAWVPAAPSVRVRLPEAPARFVYDEAGVLSTEERRVLEDSLMAFDKRGLEIGVAIFKSLQGDPIEDVSMALAEKWKPGNAERDNGAMIVVGMDERGVRIEVGYGLEPLVNDAMAGRIIRNDISPLFREGRYGAGLTRAVSSIARLARGETLAEPESSEPPAWLPLVFIVIFLLIFVGVARRSRRGWISKSGWTGGGWSGGPFLGGGSFGGFGGGGSFGGGGGSFGGGSSFGVDTSGSRRFGILRRCRRGTRHRRRGCGIARDRGTAFANLVGVDARRRTGHKPHRHRVLSHRWHSFFATPSQVSRFGALVLDARGS